MLYSLFSKSKYIPSCLDELHFPSELVNSKLFLGDFFKKIVNIRNFYFKTVSKSTLDLPVFTKLFQLHVLNTMMMLRCCP